MMSTTSSGNPSLAINPDLGLVSTTREVTSPPHVLTPADSPAMKFAIALCGEIFPGSAVDVEIMCDPEDPDDRSWYCLTVDWPGSIRDCIDRTSQWNHRFDAVHREAINDFVVSVTPI
jgi:hypothetical protein